MNNLIDVTGAITAKNKKSRSPVSTVTNAPILSFNGAPITDSMVAESHHLNQITSFKTDYDFKAFYSLEKRLAGKKVRGGIVFKSPFRLANYHATCAQCLYAFELDTYGRGCLHECLYCYAKAELTQFSFWNRPFPAPVDINEIRKVFYSVFETDQPSRWRSIMTKRIPLRIGSMSDSFMWMDQKYKVTKELLKILKHYDYPYLVFTRSDLIAHNDYMTLLDQKLCSIQFSISSIDEAFTKIIEPGAPSAKRRLLAAKKLIENGHWVTIRLNPFFPIFPDGYFTDSNFKWEGEVPTFKFSSFEMVDEIANYGIRSILAGFPRLSPFALNQINKACGIDLRTFFRRDQTKKSARDFHYSDAEVRYYYEELKRRANARKVEFTTCYIGNGEVRNPVNPPTQFGVKAPTHSERSDAGRVCVS